MNKSNYLKNKNVSSFISYLIDLLNTEEFSHSISVRDRNVPAKFGWTRPLHHLNINSLEEAYRNYWWNSGDFDENTVILNKVATHIKSAVEAEKSPQAEAECLNAIHEVLKWGAGGVGQGLYRANIKWARDQGVNLVERMRKGREAMTSLNLDHAIFSNVGGPRMNAGFTKYYSLACRDVVIYDGRVGAALGLLTRKYCCRNGLTAVPPELAFRWGPQKAINPKNALNRNPSEGAYIFSQLPSGGGAGWAECNIKANWILSTAKDLSHAKWCSGIDGLRRIEAALFTIGYSVPVHEATQ